MIKSSPEPFTGNSAIKRSRKTTDIIQTHDSETKEQLLKRANCLLSEYQEKNYKLFNMLRSYPERIPHKYRSLNELRKEFIIPTDKLDKIFLSKNEQWIFDEAQISLLHELKEKGLVPLEDVAAAVKFALNDCRSPDCVTNSKKDNDVFCIICKLIREAFPDAVKLLEGKVMTKTNRMSKPTKLVSSIPEFPNLAKMARKRKEHE